MKLGKALVTIASAALVLGGCSNDSESSRAALQVIHAVDDAPAVNAMADRVLGGQNVETGELEFGDASPVVEVASGFYDVSAEATVPGGTAEVIAVPDIAISKDGFYRIIAVGTADAGDSVDLEPLLIEDTIDTVADMVTLNVAHLAPAAPAVDVYLTAPAADLSATDPALSSVEFKDYSGSLMVAPGDYQVRITLPGSTTPVYDSGTLSLAADTNLFVAAVNNTKAGDSPVSLLVVAADADENVSSFMVTDAGAGFELRAVHGSPDAGTVDVFLDAVKGVDSLSYPDVAPDATSYLTGLTPATYTVSVAPEDAGVGAAVLSPDVTFELGGSYTAVAVGRAGDASLDLLALEDTKRDIATQATVRLVHGSSLAGTVDIYLVPDGQSYLNLEPAFSSVPYKANTGFFAAAAGDYTVVVTAAGVPTPAALEVPVTLENGEIYTAIVVDNATEDGADVIALDGLAP